jgi:hypothetical protein
LIADRGVFDGFRQLFGDERTDYNAALSAYYAGGPLADWQNAYISAYASVHPLEDWAETWSHYLHMVDTLETAAACGITLQPRGPTTVAQPVSPFVISPDAPFDQLIDGCFPDLCDEQPQSRAGPRRRVSICMVSAGIDKLRCVHSQGEAVPGRGVDRSTQG